MASQAAWGWDRESRPLQGRLLSSQNGPDPHSKTGVSWKLVLADGPHRLAIPRQRKGQRPADSPTQAGEKIFLQLRSEA